jgi:hypothetical protein
VSIADGYETDACQDGVYMPVRADERIGGRWNEERGVYASQRCEDAIAEYAQVVVHAARDALAWSTTGCGVGVGGEGAPNLSEVLARRFERHGPRIDGRVSELRDEKMRRCLQWMVRKYDEWASSESVHERCSLRTRAGSARYQPT